MKELLLTIPDNTIIGYAIRMGLEQGLIDSACWMIWDQSCDNLKATIECVGQEVLTAVIDYVSKQAQP